MQVLSARNPLPSGAKVVYELDLGSPAAPYAVHDDVVMTGSAQNITTGFVQPDGTYGRTIDITTVFSGGDGEPGTVTLHGTRAGDGAAISQDYDYTDPNGETIHGTKAFASITAAHVAGKGGAASGVIGLQTGGRLGLGRTFSRVPFIHVYHDEIVDGTLSFAANQTSYWNIDAIAVEGNTLPLNHLDNGPDGTPIVMTYYQ